MQDSTTTPPDDARRAFTAGLRQLADFLELAPDAPLPYQPSIGTHVSDQRDAYRLAVELGMTEDPASSSAGYVVWRARFGPIGYHVQTLRSVADETLLASVAKVLERPLTDREKAVALGHLDAGALDACACTGGTGECEPPFGPNGGCSRSDDAEPIEPDEPRQTAGESPTQHDVAPDPENWT